MRVLHFIGKMVVGGAERQLVQLTRALTSRQVDVHVAIADHGPLDEALESAGATVHRVRSRGPYDPALPIRLARLISTVKPDVVQTWLVRMDIAAGVAAAMAGVPWVLSERSSSDAYFPSVLHFVRRRVGRHARRIVANSPAGGDYWRTIVGHEGVRVVPNIVAQREIDAAVPVADTVSPGQIILSAAGFREEKNLVRLVDAIALVMNTQQVTAVFCGDGPLRQSIESRTKQLGISHRVLFAGVVDNVWSWMKRSSVVAAVSLWEGNPNSVLESIACGTPLVVSDIDAHRALLGDSGAFVVDARSIESIAAGLRQALSDAEESRIRAQRARVALAGRTADVVAAQYEGVYREIVNL